MARFHLASVWTPARLSGEVRVLELADHPFFLATLFQPELAADTPRVHPVIRAFATAGVSQAARRRARWLGQVDQVAG